MTPTIVAFAKQLETEGYGFISLPNGIKLRNTNTSTDHSLDALTPKYVRWSAGKAWNPNFVNELYLTLPFIESVIFDPNQPTNQRVSTVIRSTRIANFHHQPHHTTM